jgi:hypothetical protein
MLEKTLLGKFLDFYNEYYEVKENHSLLSALQSIPDKNHKDYRLAYKELSDLISKFILKETKNIF